jgi:HK97 family phage major capsid protein
VPRHEAVELREQRASVWEQMKEINDLAEAESRDLTAEEAEKFDKLQADFDQLEARYERIESLGVPRAARSRPRASAPQDDPSTASVLQVAVVRDDRDLTDRRAPRPVEGVRRCRPEPRPDELRAVSSSTCSGSTA